MTGGDINFCWRTGYKSKGKWAENNNCNKIHGVLGNFNKDRHSIMVLLPFVFLNNLQKKTCKLHLVGSQCILKIYYTHMC